MTKQTIAFEITSWDQAAAESDPGILRATVKKKFSGALEGTSTAEVLMYRASETSGAYIAIERVTGTLDGKSGTFVIQHGGIAGDDGAPVAFGKIVPGSGTEELAGLHGDAQYGHDEQGARVTLDYELP